MTKLRLNGCAWVLLLQCLITALPALRLLHVVDWPWRWVTIPLWGPGTLLAAVLLVEWLVELGRPKSKS